MEHLNQEELLSLVHGRLSMQNANRILVHARECNECRTRYAALREMAYDPEGAWENFVDILTGESETPHTFTLAVQIIMESADRIAAVGTRLASDLAERFLGGAAPIQFEFSPAYSGVGSDEERNKIVALQEQAADLCGEGEIAAACDKLREVAELEKSAAEYGEVTGQAPGDLRVEISASASRREIAVKVWPSATQRPASEGWQILLLARSGDVMRKTKFESVQGAAYLLAELCDVADGDWVVALDTLDERT